MKMATGSRAIRIHEAIHPDGETFVQWVKRAFSKERIAEMALAGATVVVLGYVGGFLYQVAQSY